MKQVRTNAVTTNEVTQRELAHRELAREAAAESIVLLKNDLLKEKDVRSLPLTPCKIALYGAGAATTIKGGTGSGEVNERYSVTIEKGLLNAGFSITTNAYLREYEVYMNAEKAKTNKNMAKGMLSRDPDVRINFMANSFQYPPGRLINNIDIEQSRESEACIYVIARQAGECSERRLERNDYNLTQTEIDNISKIASIYKNVILVINTTGPMDLTPLDSINGINSILFFCQQGMEGGNALADIITGKVSPSGALTNTWSRKYEDWPYAMEYSYLKGHANFEEYKEGIYVGYRYFDSFNVTPRYEFGYGLSYTEFNIDFVYANADKTKITVKAKVTNTGNKYSGKKIVQLFASAPANQRFGGKLIREYQSLVAFAKTEILAPGASCEVSLSFDLRDIAGYDEEEKSFILEQGDYILRLGESSKKTNEVSVITLDKTAVTEVCRNICQTKIDFTELKAETITHNISDNVQRININSDDIPVKKHEYNVVQSKLSKKTQEVLEKLSIEDMIKVVVATGYMDTDQYFSVPGAAANTTSHLSKELGVPNAALCDGPAGLRVQRTSVRLKNGKIKPVEAPMEFMQYMPWYLKKIIMGNPKKGELLYQYTSAFPVGTSLAQTWNSELVEQIGKAIGMEMTEYGVTFLLAPGMNIQRNPLCGRNYEYYSEDPLLTGKIAAAITKGVQSFDGCYVTIKHYAANNQETNRNKSDSRLTERTLREIYLKGFRIAVEESTDGKGGAKSVMTSYNKLNGTYTPNSYDLCTNVLRCEWGFNGVVMTDWSSTEKGLASNGLAIKAGNDLICPGGGSVIKALENDLKEGIVSEEELKLSCSRVLEAVINGRTGLTRNAK